MAEGKKKLVKCLVCGAIFEDGTAICPICGVTSENFVPYEEVKKEYHKDTEELFLILGNGAAGLSAAEAIRERNSTCSVVMVGDEDLLPYSRPMLTKVMLGENNREDMLLHNLTWYEEHRILNLTGRRAVSIDPILKEVTFVGGIRLKYDKLIYALGSECFIPPIPGHEKSEVIAIRRLRDIERISVLLPQTKRAVVIGGGVLGLEAAWELKKSGCQVTILELSAQLMGRQLDTGAGAYLRQLISDIGIQVCFNVKIEAIEGDQSVTGVRLGDGAVIPAELVIISAGVRANTAIAETAGAELGRAIKVNTHMETTVPNIYACGDCAEFEGINYAIWSEAVEMGHVAGANAAGDNVYYETVLAALTFNGMEISLYAVGDVGKNSEKQYQIEHIEDVEKKIYKTFYYVEGKMTGAVLIGDMSDMQKVSEAIGK